MKPSGWTHPSSRLSHQLKTCHIHHINGYKSSIALYIGLIVSKNVYSNQSLTDIHAFLLSMTRPTITNTDKSNICMYSDFFSYYSEHLKRKFQFCINMSESKLKTVHESDETKIVCKDIIIFFLSLFPAFLVYIVNSIRTMITFD